jgi:hypothetical protein
MAAINRRKLLGLGFGTTLALVTARSLAQTTARLEVTVVADDVPLAGIPVQVESAALVSGVMVQETDADGVARLELDSGGLCNVRVEAPGYQLAVLLDVPVPLGSTSSVTLNLVPRVPGGGSY